MKIIRNRILLALFAVTCFLILFLPQAAYSESGLQESKNLLRNADFETGSTNSWEGISADNLVTDPTHTGSYAIRITTQEASQGNIPVVPGVDYLLTMWYRWEIFEGQDWGSDRIVVFHPDWSEAASITKLHQNFEPGQWHKVALAFTAQDSTVRVSLGMHGPQEKVELYFDDLFLSEKGENSPPVAQASADEIFGEAPFTVQFSANSQDVDGTVNDHYWDFGDGSVATIEDPEHTFVSPGAYSVKLTVRDNEGFPAVSYRTVFVKSSKAPTIEIQSTLLTSHQEQKLLALSGEVVAPAGSEIRKFVWDHVSNGTAGMINITPGEKASWNLAGIELKPGKNEILLTATDDKGGVSTEKVVLHRPSSGPRISQVEASSAEVGLFEKYEVNFHVETVAENTFFKYDPDPPDGVAMGIGVSVTGIFKSPSGQTLKQPAFYHQEAESVPCGGSTCYQQTGQAYWTLRFAPQELGDYQVQIQVEDASGNVTLPIDGFTAVKSNSKGFVRVSKLDPRYFEFSNGELFWPIGPANGSDYKKYKGSGQNIERPWMAGKGAYSTNFARWISSAKEMGNEGFDSNLNYLERYPGHELTQVLTYPEANRLWIGWLQGEPFRPLLNPGTKYQVMLRIKTANISGPVDPDSPYGLMLKKHGWPDESFEEDMRQWPSMITPVAYNADWHTVVDQFTASDRDGDNDGRPFMTLYLDNVSAGEVFIDHFSIREIMPDGQLGRELMINCSADLHTYIEPGPAAYFDWQINQGEQNGVYFKYVVHDKRDWIQSHLNQYGLFVESGNGYYQEANTKARWLLEQWWRYLIARWGYSTAVHSWELNNEGPPNDRSHFQMTQDFAKFMHENDSHPHLATTSFWSDWIPEFWGNRLKYPDPDYANIHEYIKERDSAYDIADWLLNSSDKVYQSQVLMPVMKGETGIGGPSDDFFEYLSEPNPGIWYHNLLWAQLSSKPIYNPNYWWSEHLKQIEREKITRTFTAFIADLELNRGGYVEAGVETDNPNLRIVGQKNMQTGAAHLWVQNKAHTWRNVMGVDNADPIVPQTGTLTLKMNPGLKYTAEFWDTYTGEIILTLPVSADASGIVNLQIEKLESDLAIKFYPE
jgi:PKD repeat protein